MNKNTKSAFARPATLALPDPVTRDIEALAARFALPFDDVLGMIVSLGVTHLQGPRGEQTVRGMLAAAARPVGQA